MSTFGKLYRVTTYGESHCKSVGCIVDGCPPGLTLTNEDIQVQLSRRRPGQSDITTPVSSCATRVGSGADACFALLVSGRPRCSSLSFVFLTSPLSLSHLIMT
jgi:chorismate synthase